MRLSVARLTAGRALRAALLASSALMSGLAHADDFQGLGFLPGTDSGVITGLSADGRFAIGVGFNAGSGAFSKSFIWTNGVMTEIAGLGSGLTQATGVNADGSVVVGYTYGSGATGFVWTPSGGEVVFNPLPAFGVARPSGVSADGSVIVGTVGGLVQDQAFRWTQSGGAVVLGVLAGDTTSNAAAVSADGNVVVGSSNNVATTRAFRWTQSTGMVDLGSLPGATFSNATATNYDGSVVVGYAIGASTHAFRWQANTGTTALPELPGALLSAAYAVNYDGSVIVGVSGSTSLPLGEAAVWTSKNGVQSIKDLLVGGGVNLAGWTLTEAKGVSADGTIVAGTGGDPSGQQEPWIARIANGLGIITAGTVAQSFAGQSSVGQTGNAAIGAGLDTLSQTAIQTGLSQDSHNKPYSAFGYGGYDSDPAATGTLGMTVDLPNAMLAGAAVSANYVKTNMVYDGSSKMAGGSGGLFLARVPNAGLQWLVSVDGTTLTGDVTRGYLNGNSVTSSTGSTTANGYGFAGRVGWTFGNVGPATQMTPFVSYTFSSIHINGYTETSGVFPAQFSGFTDNAQTSRFGVDARFTFMPGKWLWGTLAWAHRLDGGKGSEISGTVIGLFSITAQGASVATDWAEVTGGVRLPLWQNGAFIASLTASVPENFPTTYAMRVGVAESF